MAPKAPTPAVQARKPASPPRPARVPKAPALTAAEPEPAEPVMPMKYFLIGETKATAAAVAEHEWGWAKTKTGWTDGAKNPVKFLEDYAALLKACNDEPIYLYLGHRWYACVPPHMLDRLVSNKSVFKMPDPAPGAPA